MLVGAAQLLAWGWLVSLQIEHIPCSMMQAALSAKDCTDLTDSWSGAFTVKLGFIHMAGRVFSRP